VELDWRVRAEPQPGLGAACSDTLPIPSLDPSLDRTLESALEPVFPNTDPLPPSRKPALHAQGDALRLPDTAPAGEVEVVQSDAKVGDGSVGRAGHASSYTSAFELRTQLYLSGHAEPGMHLELYGMRMTADERGDFNLLKDVDPDNPLIAELLHPKKP